eukprot:176363-Prorocentrum_minimum.AAC.1
MRVAATRPQPTNHEARTANAKNAKRRSRKVAKALPTAWGVPCSSERDRCAISGLSPTVPSPSLKKYRTRTALGGGRRGSGGRFEAS